MIFIYYFLRTKLFLKNLINSIEGFASANTIFFTPSSCLHGMNDILTVFVGIRKHVSRKLWVCHRERRCLSASFHACYFKRANERGTSRMTFGPLNIPLVQMLVRAKRNYDARRCNLFPRWRLEQRKEISSHAYSSVLNVPWDYYSSNITKKIIPVHWTVYEEYCLSISVAEVAE